MALFDTAIDQVSSAATGAVASISTAFRNTISGLTGQGASGGGSAGSVPSSSSPMGQGSEVFYKLIITAATPTGGTKTISAWLPDTFTLDVTSEYDTPAANMLNQVIGGWMDKHAPKAAGLARIAGTIARAQTGYTLVAQDMTTFVWAGSAPWTFTLPFVFTADTDAKLDVTNQVRDLMMLAAPRRGALGLLVSPGPTIDIAGLVVDLAKQISSKIPEAGDLLSDVTSFITDQEKRFQSLITSVPGSSINDSGPNRASQTMQSASGAQAGGVNTTPNQAQQDDWGMWSSHIKHNVSLLVGKFMRFPSVVVVDVGSVYNTIFDTFGNPVRASVNVTFKTLMTPTQDDLNRMFLTADPG